MKKSLLGVITAVTISLLFSQAPLAYAGPPGITVYNDQDAFLAALAGSGCTVRTEDFNDAVFVPGLSVVSDAGSIAAGVSGFGTTNIGSVAGGFWDGRVNDGAVGTLAETTWSFAPNSIAFGGYWDTFNPSGPGSTIDIERIDGVTVTAMNVPDTHGSGGTAPFQGFISDVKFTKVMLSDPTVGGLQENYDFDDMIWADCRAIGGDIMSIDNTALLLAGAQTSLVWLLPILVAGAGIAVYRFKKSA